MADPNVNVIFHGLFLFVERQASIDVLIPNMGGDHLYKAGSFLVEETLIPQPIRSPYFLRGVLPGSAAFDDKANIVFTRQGFNAMAPQEDVHSRIVLPKPASIISLRPTQDPYKADVDPQKLMDGRTTCGVQVLRYFAPDLDEVTLDRHPAILNTHPPDDPKFLNLHIISEEDFESNTDHPRRGFDRTLHLIPGLRGTIHISNSTVLTPAEDDHKAEGFSVLETYDTRERMSILAQAGLDWREGKPNLPGADFVNEPPFDCVPLYVREDS
jgi:hypothetical protein